MLLWKRLPSETYSKEANQNQQKSVHWKCQMTKEDFEEHATKSIKTKNKELFKYIRCRKTARGKQLDDNEIKGVIKKDKGNPLSHFCIYTDRERQIMKRILWS